MLIVTFSPLFISATYKWQRTKEASGDLVVMRTIFCNEEKTSLCQTFAGDTIFSTLVTIHAGVCPWSELSIWWPHSLSLLPLLPAKPLIPLLFS